MINLVVMCSEEVKTLLTPWLAYDALVKELAKHNAYKITAVSVNDVVNIEQYSAFVFFTEGASAELLALAVTLELKKRHAIAYVSRSHDCHGKYTKRFIKQERFVLLADVEQSALDILRILKTEERKNMPHTTIERPKLRRVS